MDIIEKGLIAALFGIMIFVAGIWATEANVDGYYDAAGNRRAFVGYNRFGASLDGAIESWEEENSGLHMIQCSRLFRSTFYAEWTCLVHDSGKES